MSDNNVVFVAGVPTPGSVGHKLHILHPSGQIQSFGDDGGVYSSQLTRWTSQRSSVTGRGDTVWAVKKDANRIVRWDLGQEPRVGRLFEREVVEFDEGAPAELVYPRSLNLAASLDDRGLWIIWIAPDPEWAERVPPGGDETPAPPREVYDSWLDLVDPVTGRTIARHRHDGYLKDFVAGSSYVAEYHETDAGVPLLHVLEPRLSICSTTGSLRAQEPERVSGAVSCDMCRITMDTIASLGGPEGQGLGVVTELSVVAVDGRGRFLIAELRQNEFSVFDASGKFIRTVGRQGEGPGEYQIGISQIAVGPQFIHVFESHRGRTLLDHAFNVVRTDRFPWADHSRVRVRSRFRGCRDDGRHSDAGSGQAQFPHPQPVGGDHVLRRESGPGWFQRDGLRGDDVGRAGVGHPRRTVEAGCRNPRVVRTIDRTVEAFDRGPRGRWPGTGSSGIKLDESGYLWILWFTPDPEWTEPEVTLQPGQTPPDPPMQRAFDDYLDVFDPRTGRTLARHWSDETIRFVNGYGESALYVYAIEQNNAGVVYLHLMKPRLEGAPGSVELPRYDGHLQTGPSRKSHSSQLPQIASGIPRSAAASSSAGVSADNTSGFPKRRRRLVRAVKRTTPCQSPQKLDHHRRPA